MDYSTDILLALCYIFCHVFTQMSVNEFEDDNKEIELMTQRQPSRGALRKRYSENMQQFYRRTPMPKYDFNKVPSQLY